MTQADIDLWHATHRTHESRCLRGFLTWAIATGRAPKLRLPRILITQKQPLTQRRRLELLRKVLADDGPIRTRVAACLMLLYAQPANRIVRLRVDDITRDTAGEVFIRLGDPPTPVPEPFAALLLRARRERENMNTATNPDSPWLFPGRRAGQPLNPGTLADHLRIMGIPTQQVRTSALRQLVLQAPAPVITRSLGFHDKTTTRIASDAGGPWIRYAPDHDSP